MEQTQTTFISINFFLKQFIYVKHNINIRFYKRFQQLKQ